MQFFRLCMIVNIFQKYICPIKFLKIWEQVKLNLILNLLNSNIELKLISGNFTLDLAKVLLKNKILI